MTIPNNLLNYKNYQIKKFAVGKRTSHNYWVWGAYQPKFLHISLSQNTWPLVPIFWISQRDGFTRIKGFHIDHCCCLFFNFLKRSITFRSKPLWGSSSCFRGEDGTMGENFKIQGRSHLDKYSSSRDQEKEKLHLRVHSYNVYLGIWRGQKISWA